MCVWKLFNCIPFGFQHYKLDNNTVYFDIDDSRFTDENEQRPTITFDSHAPQKYVVLHNTVPRVRETIVEFLVSKPFVMVETFNGSSIISQIAPVWSWQNASIVYSPEPSTTAYRVLFKVTVPPLGLATYIIRSTNSAEESM